MLPDVTLLSSSVDLKGLDIHYGEHFIKPMTGKGGTISISLIASRSPKVPQGVRVRGWCIVNMGLHNSLMEPYSSYSPQLLTSADGALGNRVPFGMS
jgi:hypothetical protein